MSEIVLEGLDQFYGKLKNITSGLMGQFAEDAVTEGADVVQSYANLNATNVFGDQVHDSARNKNNTGHIRNSIMVEVQRTQGGACAEIGPSAIYGRVQEMGGTIRPKTEGGVLKFQIDGQWRSAKQVTLPPRPYLKPAVEDHQDEIIRVMTDSLADNLAGI